MILKRYGTAYQSVEPDFDSKALNEITFRRDRQRSIPADEMESGWERGDVHELAPQGEGDVQDEAEQRLLDDLLGQIRSIEEGLDDDQVLVVESEPGQDWPKTRHVQKNVVVEGENRLYFHNRVEPPLRVSVWRKRG